MLNLREALHLYELLGKHIPKDVNESADVISFIGRIVSGIVQADEHRRFIDAVVLMSGKSSNEILALSIEHLLLEFSTGLIQNHILLLCRFCEDLGYGRN